MKPLTLAQAKLLTPNDYLCSRIHKKKDGRPITVRVNGQPQVWKRNPGAARVPWKYGLYEYGAVTETDLKNWTLCTPWGDPAPAKKRPKKISMKKPKRVRMQIPIEGFLNL